MLGVNNLGELRGSYGSRFTLTAVTVSPKNPVASAIRRFNPRPFEDFSHWT